MAGYSVRPLAELSQQARGFFTQTIPGAIASVWANTFTIVGKVIALLNHEHELRRAWLFRQTFASTADDLWLERHGFELGMTRTAATVATGTITVAATPGTVVPAGLTWTRPDGLTFTTDAGTAAGNSVTLDIEPDLPGAIGNTDAGATLTLDQAADVAGLDGQGTVDDPGISGGSDREALETFRARVLARKRQPPQGGSAPDYQRWIGEALPVVQDAWVDSFLNDARSVWVMFTVTDQPNGIPSDGQVAIAQAYLDDPVRRPVTARVFVMAPVAVPTDVTVADLSPDTADVRANVEAELAAVFADRVRPSTPSSAFTLHRDWLDEAVSRATGEDSHAIPSPAADQTYPVGSMPVLGVVSFI
jgi:uncharacterized phage protein gp47/JayE